MFIYFGTNCFSQEKYALISGKIISSNKTVSDVHIINLNTKLGTVSNDKGEFELLISLNDTLLFSSVEYERRKIRMTGNFIKYKKIVVDLIPSLNELEEIFIEGLTGSLSYDINKVPKDTLKKHSFFLKPGDLKKALPPDLHGSKKAPYVGFFPPISGSIFLPDPGYEAEQRLKRELSRKKQFPIKIRKQLGLDYFTKKLNIPEEKIDNFLAYCEDRDIVAEYYKNNLLKVIQILREESENYNAIKN